MSPAEPTSTRSTSDEPSLVARIAQQEPQALAELYDRYSGMLLGLAARILGTRADAEEVLQEVFLQVWSQAARYDPGRSSVSTWLVLITRSRAIDRLRSRQVGEKKAQAAHQENPRHDTSPEGDRSVLFHERRKRLRQELQDLPAEQREVIELAFYQDLTQSEIAERTGIPLGTVKTRTLLAMKKLRRALGEEIRELL